MHVRDRANKAVTILEQITEEVKQRYPEADAEQTLEILNKVLGIYCMTEMRDAVDDLVETMGGIARSRLR